MPLLYRDRSIQFFPAGIDNADYAVLNGNRLDGKLNYYGVVTYLGAGERAQLNELTLERLRRDGYDLDHPRLFPALGGLAVVQRMH